jgi:SAM-dependent methyltransferase
LTGDGWRRLVRRSYGLGLRWLVRGTHTRWRGARVGLNRLLVPLDPWRFWELGRVAEESFSGTCLDVSSPKLLPSLLQSEGKGRWHAIDRFDLEIHRWKHIDPMLSLEVCDARRLPFADQSFDHALTISVLEHIPGDGDKRALRELFRVLRPGGILHLTTNVASKPRTLYCEEPVWGAASAEPDGRIFFERHYSPAEITRLLQDPWERLAEEWAIERKGWIHDLFTGFRPLSYLAGGLLRFLCPGNFVVAATPAILPPRRHGVLYLKLRKPTTVPSITLPGRSGGDLRESGASRAPGSP